MFLRHKIRRKDGKEHLYLGEINDAQQVLWCRTEMAAADVVK